MRTAEQSARPRIESPLSVDELIDLYFLDVRAKAIDIAAFLDRIDRAGPGSNSGAKGEEDFRLAALKKALTVVAASDPEKAKAVQMILSDPTTEPIDSAAGMKGAAGAYPGAKPTE